MAESESGRRSTAGPPSLASLPQGTRMVTVSRLVAGTHRRGGERQHLGRVAPGEIGTFLAAQGPGRYRIACVGLGGRFVRNGAFAVEVEHENLQPQVVRARTSRDYLPEGTPLASARRRERQAIQRVRALREQVRIPSARTLVCAPRTVRRRRGTSPRASTPRGMTADFAPRWNDWRAKWPTYGLTLSGETRPCVGTSTRCWQSRS